jgi:hypothetical protein
LFTTRNLIARFSNEQVTPLHFGHFESFRDRRLPFPRRKMDKTSFIHIGRNSALNKPSDVVGDQVEKNARDAALQEEIRAENRRSEECGSLNQDPNATSKKQDPNEISNGDKSGIGGGNV